MFKAVAGAQKMKTKYVETAPEQKEIIFDSHVEFREFWDKRWDEMFNAYQEKFGKWDWSKESISTFSDRLRKEFWIAEYYKIRKDGTRPKEHPYPDWLHSKTAQENQKINWHKYLEKKVQEKKDTPICPLCGKKKSVVKLTHPTLELYLCNKCKKQFILVKFAEPPENEPFRGDMGQNNGLGNIKSPPNLGGISKC